MKQLKILLLTSMVISFSAYGMDVNVTEDTMTGSVQGMNTVPTNSYKIEAESFSRSSGYVIQNSSSASNGQIIKATNINQNNSATTLFSGTSDTYDMVIRYLDEDDGVSTIMLYVNDSLKDTVTLSADNNNWIDRTIPNIALQIGDEIKIVSVSRSGEFARVDYIELLGDSEAVHHGQVKDSRTGNGLADVKVSISESSTTTDVNGYYTLPDLEEKDKVVVNFEKEGYLLGSTKIQIKNTPSTNYLEYSMYAHDYQRNHDSAEEILSPHISIAASVSYLKTEGTKYSGIIEVEVTILDNDEDELLNSFPGSFKGINTNGEVVPFVSYGLISLSFKDTNGNTLNLASDTGVTLTFKAVPSSEEENIIPLWYYDYEQGVWKEEGYAELQADDTYKGDIQHSGIWSMNKPIENDLGIYRGRIINEDGSPISDVRLQAIGNNWIGSDLSTDENGVFEIEVVPGKSFKLSAYNYKDKYKASHNSTLAAIASGNIVED